MRFGFIGLGGMARSHAGNLKRFPQVNIVAACDAARESLDSFGDEHGIEVDKRYTDYGALIADKDVDVIVCVTPNHLHAEIIRACLQARKPFMAEKPFTRTFEEAEELLELYKSNPVANMIGFSYRYLPQFRYAKQMIASGAIGAVRHMMIQYLQQFGSSSNNFPMAWRFDKAIAGTGALGDLGSHMIDMARFLVGEIDEVSGRLTNLVSERKDPKTGQPVSVEVDDLAVFHAVLEGGVPAVFQTSRNAIGFGNHHEAILFGDEGTIMVSSSNRDEVTWIHSEAGEIKRELLPVPKDQGVDQWDEFMNVLQGNQSELITTVHDGYINQAVLEAVVISDRERRTVAVEELIKEE